MKNNKYIPATMNKIHKNIFLVAASFSLLLTILFTGFSRDDEFNEPNVFLKYRPTLQMYFDSPLGMQDMPSDYPADLSKKQSIYEEFVLRNHPTDNPVFIWIPISLFATTLCLSTIGIHQLKNRLQLKWWKLILYLIFSIIVIAVATGFMLLKDEGWLYALCTVGILLLNYSMFFLLFLKNSKNNNLTE